MENKWTIGNVVYMVNALVMVLAILLAGVKVAVAQDQRPVAVPQERTFSAHDRGRLAAADPVDRQLARYSRLIPELGFLRIYGERGAQFVNRLPALIGRGAVDMDYAHDATQKRDVVDLQLYRIAKMVEQGLPSATLFKLGADSAFDHRYLCVVTLDTRPFRRDPAYATNFMTSEIEPGLTVNRNEPYIRNEDFLRFTVDHEAFHCLDAYFNGAPFRKTSDPVTSHYDHYLSELKADAYASLMFSQARKHKKDFLARFAALRTQSLAATDTFHVTSDIVGLAANICLDVDMLEPEEVVHIATKLVNQASPGLAEYGKYLANMIAVIDRLGGSTREIKQALELESLPQPDESRVAALVEQVETGRRQISGDESSVAVVGSSRPLTEDQNDS